MENPNLISHINQILVSQNAFIKPTLGTSCLVDSERKESSGGLTNESVTDGDDSQGNFYRINMQTSSADTKSREHTSVASVIKERMLDFEEASAASEQVSSAAKHESFSSPFLSPKEDPNSFFLAVHQQQKQLQLQLTSQDNQIKEAEVLQEILKKENNSLQQIIQSYKDKVSIQTKQNENLVNENRQMKMELEGYVKQADKLKKEFRKESDNFKKEIELMKKKKEDLIREKEQTQHEIDDFKRKLEEWLKDLGILKIISKTSKLQEQFQSIRNCYENKLSHYKTIIEELKTTVLNKENQVKEIENQSLNAIKSLQEDNMLLQSKVAQLQQEQKTIIKEEGGSAQLQSTHLKISKKRKSIIDQSKSTAKQNSLDSHQHQKLQPNQNTYTQIMSFDQQNNLVNKIFKQSIHPNNNKQILNQTQPLPRHQDSVSPPKKTSTPISQRNDEWQQWLLNQIIKQKKQQECNSLLNSHEKNQKRSLSQQTNRARSPFYEAENNLKLVSDPQNIDLYPYNFIEGKQETTENKSEVVNIIQNQYFQYCVSQNKKENPITSSQQSKGKKSNSSKGNSVIDIKKIQQRINDQRLNKTMGPRFSDKIPSLSPFSKKSHVLQLSQNNFIEPFPRAFSQQTEQRFNKTMDAKVNDNNKSPNDPPSPLFKKKTKDINSIKSLLQTHPHPSTFSQSYQYPPSIFLASPSNPSHYSPKTQQSTQNVPSNHLLNTPKYPLQFDKKKESILLNSVKQTLQLITSQQKGPKLPPQRNKLRSDQDLSKTLLIPASLNTSKHNSSAFSSSQQSTANSVHQSAIQSAKQSTSNLPKEQYQQHNTQGSNHKGQMQTQIQNLNQTQKLHAQALPHSFNASSNTSVEISQSNQSCVASFSPLSSIQSDFLSLGDQDNIPTRGPTPRKSSQQRVGSSKINQAPKIPKSKQGIPLNNTLKASVNNTNQFPSNLAVNINDVANSMCLKLNQNLAGSTPLSATFTPCSTGSNFMQTQQKQQDKLKQFPSKQRNNKIRTPFLGNNSEGNNLSFYDSIEPSQIINYGDVTNYLENHAMENNVTGYLSTKKAILSNTVNLSSVHHRSRSEQAQYNNYCSNRGSSSRNGKNSSNNTPIGMSNPRSITQNNMPAHCKAQQRLNVQISKFEDL